MSNWHKVGQLLNNLNDNFFAKLSKKEATSNGDLERDYSTIIQQSFKCLKLYKSCINLLWDVKSLNKTNKSKNLILQTTKRFVFALCFSILFTWE